jgi:hypothetical protein
MLWCSVAMATDIKVFYLKGSAKVTPEEGESRVLKKGDLVDEGDTISTGENSLIILKIAGHSTHRVESSTILKIDSLPYFFEGSEEIEEGSSFTLKVGTILSDIINKSDVPVHTVKTKSTAMAVRGTELLTSVDESNTWLAVNEGEVEVFNSASSSREFVDKNQSLVVEGDTRFTKKKRYDWQKNIEWGANKKELKKQFRANRKARLKEFRKKREKWTQNKLLLSKRLAKIQKREKKWRSRTSELSPNKRRQELRKKRRRFLRKKSLHKRLRRKSSDGTNTTPTSDGGKTAIKKDRVREKVKEQLLRERIKKKRRKRRNN